MASLKRVAVAGVIIAILSAPVLAQTRDQIEANKVIDRLGVQINGHAYFSVDGGFALNCEWGNVYVDVTSVSGRAAYAELLVAKAAGKQLSRIDYTQASPGNMCTLSLVEIQQ